MKLGTHAYRIDRYIDSLELDTWIYIEFSIPNTPASTVDWIKNDFEGINDCSKRLSSSRAYD
jgi:hypothetical protein